MRFKVSWKDFFSLLLLGYSLINIALFANLFLSAFKKNADLFQNTWGFPKEFILTNFVALVNNGFLVYFRNSVIVLLCSLFLLLFIASMTAYGLGRFQFKGNTVLYLYFLVGMMFPVQLGIVPLYVTVRTLHLTNTLIGLILIESSVMSLAVFVLTNFLKTIPTSISESARLDGANEFTIFTMIVMPMMRPALGALVPLSMVNIWNDLFIPLVILTDENVKTVPIGLMKFFNPLHMDLSKLNLTFTAVAVATLPMLLLFVLGSKQMINGIAQGAIK